MSPRLAGVFKAHQKWKEIDHKTQRLYEQGLSLFANHRLKDGTRAGSKQISDFTKGLWTRTYSSVYRYVGAKVDLSRRGFLGLRQTSVTDLQTNITSTTTAADAIRRIDPRYNSERHLQVLLRIGCGAILAIERATICKWRISQGCRNAESSRCSADEICWHRGGQEGVLEFPVHKQEVSLTVTTEVVHNRCIDGFGGAPKSHPFGCVSCVAEKVPSPLLRNVKRDVLSVYAKLLVVEDKDADGNVVRRETPPLRELQEQKVGSAISVEVIRNLRVERRDRRAEVPTVGLRDHRPCKGPCPSRCRTEARRRQTRPVIRTKSD
jgi:hypothetical protein